MSAAYLRGPEAGRVLADERRASSCQGKVAFASPNVARMVADRRNGYADRFPVPSEPYRCPLCGQWHVGKSRIAGKGNGTGYKLGLVRAERPSGS